MKKKTLTGLISGLICCSLVGVGFAAWVVTGDASKDLAGGTITAEEITDASIEISNLKWGEDTAGNPNIYFGAPASMTNEKAWLVNNNATSEDLTAKCTFTIKNFESLNGDPTATITVLTGSDAFTAAKNANVIAEPTAKVSNLKNGNFSVAVTFAWGSDFNNQNPYTYYNAKEASTPIGNKTAKEDAIEKLRLVAALNKATFKLTIEAKSNNGQQPA